MTTNQADILIGLTEDVLAASVDHYRALRVLAVLVAVIFGGLLFVSYKLGRRAMLLALFLLPSVALGQTDVIARFYNGGSVTKNASCIQVGYDGASYLGDSMTLQPGEYSSYIVADSEWYSQGKTWQYRTRADSGAAWLAWQDLGQTGPTGDNQNTVWEITWNENGYATYTNYVKCLTVTNTAYPLGQKWTFSVHLTNNPTPANQYSVNVAKDMTHTLCVTNDVDFKIIATGDRPGMDTPDIREADADENTSPNAPPTPSDHSSDGGEEGDLTDNVLRDHSGDTFYTNSAANDKKNTEAIIKALGDHARYLENRLREQGDRVVGALGDLGDAMSNLGQGTNEGIDYRPWLNTLVTNSSATVGSLSNLVDLVGGSVTNGIGTNGLGSITGVGTTNELVALLGDRPEIETETPSLTMPFSKLHEELEDVTFDFGGSRFTGTGSESITVFGVSLYSMWYSLCTFVVTVCFLVMSLRVFTRTA